MRLPTLCAVALLALPATAGAQSLAPQTRWVNDHGSELLIQSIAPDGRLYAEWSLAYFDTATKRPTLNRGTDVYRPK